jgi:hypothetical protein
MRSGLGSKEELAKLDIDCLVDLPGVGKVSSAIVSD